MTGEGENVPSERKGSKWPRLALLCWLVPLGSAAQGEVLAHVRHDPLLPYAVEEGTPAEPQARMTQIIAEFEVTGASLPIRRIEIVAVRGNVRLCGTTNKPINLPCRTDSQEATKVCEFSRTRRAACKASFDFGYDETKAFPHRERNELITYRATVVLGSSKAAATESLSTQSVTFAALRRGAERENGWKRIAIPIWWHMEQPLSKWVDLAFVPDRASPGFDGQPRWSYWQFLQGVEDLAERTFLGEAGPSHLSLLRERIDRINLWVTPWGGRPGEEGLCDFDLSRRIRAISSWMDATVLLHNQKRARECSEIGRGSTGSTLVSSVETPWIFGHELGHYLGAQSDEYCCGGGYDPGASFLDIEPNVYCSEAECRAHWPECRLMPTSWRGDLFRGLDRRLEVPETMAFPIPLRPSEDSDWGIGTRMALEKVLPDWTPSFQPSRRLVKNSPGGLESSPTPKGPDFTEVQPDPFLPHWEANTAAVVAVLRLDARRKAGERVQFYQPLERWGEKPDLVPATTTLRTADLSDLQVPWTESDAKPQARFRLRRLFAREGASPVTREDWFELLPFIFGLDERMLVEVEEGRGIEVPFLEIFRAACRELAENRNREPNAPLTEEGCNLLKGSLSEIGPGSP